nr:RluA family pseudouridine synthase [Clostridiales bacterium]
IVENGPEARTGYEVLSYHGGYTLLRLIPYTGKTHQLRVHMSSVGFPLAGDFMYGAEDRSLIARPALHSYELWMRHPMTGEDLHFVCPLPEDMRHILETN